jgi:hypothetical protein
MGNGRVGCQLRLVLANTRHVELRSQQLDLCGVGTMALDQACAHVVDFGAKELLFVHAVCYLKGTFSRGRVKRPDHARLASIWSFE